jgi:hypothetical protein
MEAKFGDFFKEIFGKPKVLKIPFLGKPEANQSEWIPARGTSLTIQLGDKYIIGRDSSRIKNARSLQIGGADNSLPYLSRTQMKLEIAKGKKSKPDIVITNLSDRNPVFWRNGYKPTATSPYINEGDKNPRLLEVEGNEGVFQIVIADYNTQREIVLHLDSSTAESVSFKIYERELIR